MNHTGKRWKRVGESSRYFTKGKTYTVKREDPDGQIIFVDDTDTEHYWEVNDGFRMLFVPDEPIEPTGPVVTETVKRIKPGIYGTVDVGLHTSPARVYINVNGAHDATELAAVIETLTAIREAIEASK